MPTVPLFDRSAAPGCWHAVQSPGGYECWTIDAADAASDTQLSVVLMEGLPQDQVYLHRYAQYRHKPTHVPPPQPREFLGVLTCVYRGGKLVHRSLSRADQITASREQLDVQIGPAKLTRDRLIVSAEGLRIDLALAAPPVVPVEKSVLRFALRMHHTWTAVAPRCEVTGTVGDLPFAGQASIEHAFGTGPAAIGVARFIRGRIFTGDGAVVFHVLTPAVRKPVDEVVLLHASASGVNDVPVKRVDLDGAYVRQIGFDDRLQLSNPRLIETHDLGVRMVYDAMFDGQSGVAHCDVIYPRQPKLPMLASLVEWSIPFA